MYKNPHLSSNISLVEEIKEFLRLAIPLATAQLTQSLPGFFDTLMMGRLGSSTLAAGGLASLSFSAIILTAGGLIMAITPAIARAFGAKDKNLLENIACQGLWLVLMLTILLTGIIFDNDFWMRVFGQTETTVIMAKIYLDIRLWDVFPALGLIWLRGVLSGLSQPGPIMLIVVIGGVFNILGNYALAFGQWGFPRLELAGLALATVITHWGMFLALIFYIFKHEPLLQSGIFQRQFSFKPHLFWQLIKLGFPMAIFSALEIGLFIVVTYLMGVLGTEVLAAHQIVLQTVAVIFMIPSGMSIAATVRVGQWLGKENWQGVQRAGALSIGVGSVFMMVMAMVLLLFPQFVIGLYLDQNDPANQPVMVLVAPMLTIAALSQIGDGVQKVAYGVLQGLQDTRLPMLLSIPAFWIIGLPLGYWLGFHLAWGGTGLWLGQSLGVAMAAIVFTRRFYYLTKVLKLSQKEM